MRTVTRRIRVLLVLLLATSTALLGAQVGGVVNQTPGEVPKGTGLLMGQVVDGSTARPVGGATVTVTAPSTAVSPTGETLLVAGPPTGGSNSAPRMILTDSQGRFMFRELSRGRYTVRVTAPGYIAGGIGQTRPGGLVQTVELIRDDEKRGDLIARLWKTASISGTILDEAGEPVIGQSIRIIRRTMVGGVPRFTSSVAASNSTTDDRGMYRMTGLLPGEYVVGVMTSTVSMPVATADAYMQILLSGGSSVNSELYRELNSSDAPSPSTTGARVGDMVLQTNGGRGGTPPVPSDGNRFLTYPPQYFPASTTTANATVITLASGEDRTGIDLQLKLVPAMKVSGVVTGPDGPARNTGVKLVPMEFDAVASESGSEIASTATDATGAFTLLGVTAGQYQLKVLRIPRPESSAISSSSNSIEISSGNRMVISMGGGLPTAAPPLLPTGPSFWANVPVTVTDTDLAGIAVTLKPGARINGRIEFEGTKEKPTPDQIQRTSLSFSPMTVGMNLQLALAAKRVEPDGRFSTVGYPPGRYIVTASVAAGGWSFRNATIGGRDVSNEGLDITGGDIADLVVTFTDQSTELTGRVMDAKGQPDKDALVVVFPADTDSWKRGVMNARRMRTTRASTTGAFTLPGLPPGAYYLAALPDATTSSEWQDPKFLEALIGLSARLTLADGEKRTQDLTTRTLR